MIVSTLLRLGHANVMIYLKPDPLRYGLVLCDEWPLLLGRLVVTLVYCIFALNAIFTHWLVLSLVDRPLPFVWVQPPVEWFLKAYMVFGWYQTLLYLLCCWKEQVGCFGMMLPRSQYEQHLFGKRLLMCTDEGVGLVKKGMVAVLLLLWLFMANSKTQDIFGLLSVNNDGYPGETFVLYLLVDALLYDAVTGIAITVGLGSHDASQTTIARTFSGHVRLLRMKQYSWSAKLGYTAEPFAGMVPSSKSSPPSSPSLSSHSSSSSLDTLITIPEGSMPLI